MNDAFEKRLRDALAQQRYEVDPGHRAAMEELVRRQDRRRPFIFWWIGTGLAGLLLLAGLAILRKPGTDEVGKSSPRLEVTSNDSGQNDKSVIGVRAEEPSTGKNTSSNEDTSTLAGPQLSKVNQTPQTGNNIHIATPGHRPTTAGYAAGPAQSKERINSHSPSSPSDFTRPPGTSREKPEANIPREPASTVLPGAASTLRASASSTEDQEVTEPVNFFNAPVPAEVIDKEPALLHREKIAMPGLASIPAARIPIAPPSVRPDVQPVSGKPWYVFAEAAGGWIPKMGVAYPSGWNVAVGAGIGFTLVPRVEAMVSAGYWVQDGGFSFLRESTVREAGFGIRSSFHRLMPDRLHHAYVRAGIQYRLRRHLVIARAGLFYLYGAQGDISLQAYDQITGQTQEQSAYAWLNTDGLRRWKAQAEFGYGYQLTPRLALSAGVLWRPGGILREDPSLASEGFTWKGRTASIQGLLTLQYRIHGNR